jgi:hypothetical protein
MRKKLFFTVFVLGISFLLFSCETLQGILDSIGGSTSGTSKSNTSGQNNGTSLSPIRNNPNRRGDSDTANWDIVALDTAADADYLSPAEKDVILEMNKARADPKKYAELYIKPMLQYNWGGPFGANSYLAPGETVYTGTTEGKNGIQSCINDLWLFREYGG